MNSAGLYIHIPFCRKACHYCDFHFSTQLENRELFVQALIKEIELRSPFLPLQTVYFGGGTPSVLSEKQLKNIFLHLKQNFNILKDAEISFEVNPEDVNSEYLELLQNLGVNRLSIGVQSFRNSDLEKMNRSHQVFQSIEAIKLAKEGGFSNITVDLMYGLPDLSKTVWQDNLAQLFDLNISHFSAYCLTIEEKTVWKHWIATQKMQIPKEEMILEHWEFLLAESKQQGFEQYEISNFAKNQQYSKHNLSYWQGKSYLGLGPSAHSFDQNIRRWNVANNQKYIKNLFENLSFFEEEILSFETQINERILTHLRTMWGINLEQFKVDFGVSALEKLQKKVKIWQDQRQVEVKNGYLMLNDEGKLFADAIAADLFF